MAAAIVYCSSESVELFIHEDAECDLLFAVVEISTCDAATRRPTEAAFSYTEHLEWPRTSRVSLQRSFIIPLKSVQSE